MKRASVSISASLRSTPINYSETGEVRLHCMCPNAQLFMMTLKTGIHKFIQAVIVFQKDALQTNLYIFVPVRTTRISYVICERCVYISRQNHKNYAKSGHITKKLLQVFVKTIDNGGDLYK